MRSAVLTLAGLVALASACDPVHSNQRDALGGEAPGVRTGPLHRPGQPCLVCHDGKIGDPSEFSVAGTVFLTLDARDPARGADVIMTDASGTIMTATTNAAGNFYFTPRQWTPSYPMKVEVKYQNYDTKMGSHIGRDGSCAGCHFDPAGPDSPGHVAVALPEGSVP